jgi:putative oxidoreductase
MIPERYAPETYALFRIVFGFIFLIYGLQKLFGWFGGQQPPLMSMGGAAGIIETFGGLLIMIGLFTKLAAFIASGEMAVAFWYIHVAGAIGAAGFPMAIVPQMNMGERAAMFCFAFLYIASRGAGIWSADAAMGGSRTSAAAAAR